MARVPAVSVNVEAVMAPDAVNVLVEAFTVRVEYVAAGTELVLVNVKAPEEAFGIDMVPVDTVTVPELESVVDTVRALAPMARVSPVPRLRVVAIRAPPAVNVLLLVVESRVRVEYVAVGIELVSVNVKAPEEAFGIDMVPVDTVTRPELESVVDTVRALAPMARVSPVSRVRDVATIAPDAVYVLSLVVESRVRVEYVLPGILLVLVNVKAPTEPLGIPDMSPVDTVMRPELLRAVGVSAYVAMASVPAVMVRLSACIAPAAVKVTAPLSVRVV